MKLLQLTNFYQNYLDDFYSNRPQLREAGYAAQMQALLEDGFNAGHMLGPYLQELGHEVLMVIGNAKHAQEAWARENGYPVSEAGDWMYRYVEAQMEHYRPEVVYTNAVIPFPAKFFNSIAYRPKLLVGWRAASIPPECDFSCYDLMLTSDSFTRENLVRHGAKDTSYFLPGFPTRIADSLGQVEKRYDVVFSGSWTPEHEKRAEFLKEVAKASISMGGGFSVGYFLLAPDANELPAGVAMYNHGARWGREMYRVLKQGRIGINGVIDFARTCSGNMRQFEVIGCGSFLLTQHHPTLTEQFQPGTEIETFADVNELTEKISHYLAHPEEREAIARMGQARCLREHSLEVRARQFDELVMRQLKGTPGAHSSFSIPGLPAGSSPTQRSAQEGETYYRQGLDLFQKGDKAGALPLLKKARELLPEHPDINHDLGVVNLHCGQVNEALESLGRARQIKPDDRRYLADHFEVLWSLGQYENARRCCLAFLQNNPDDQTAQQLALRLFGSWATAADYVRIHPTTILSAGSALTVRHAPRDPGVCVEIGAYSQFFGNISIEKPGASVRIGDRTHVGGGTTIAAAQNVTIGNDVLIAWNATFLDSDAHGLQWEQRQNDVMQCWRDWVNHPQNYIQNKDWSSASIAPITVGDKAWIGFGASILRGVRIGEGAVIGAHAVVKGDVPPYQVAVGNPAKIIKSLK